MVRFVGIGETLRESLKYILVEEQRRTFPFCSAMGLLYVYMASIYVLVQLFSTFIDLP